MHFVSYIFLFFYVADLQNGGGTRVGVIVNRRKTGVGSNFTRMGQDFYFYHGLGLGQHRIYSVVVG